MNWYLFLGFSIIWLILFAYLWFLFSRHKKLAEEIDYILRKRL